ncbi:MAG: hypothetical protein UT05_C0010G0018 [Parcubacteria group bacterium GW2011_GWF2_38_76]|nr:MAG: hypothetical protein UT05_C0010G0018 [Parcubacteria group bacterium GW2011_GWF2_38_76]HBM45551.1 hypothetical protein [Patescibacteria group bacterium]
MKKCPNCGEWKYQHNGFLGKYECYGCGNVETNREKERSIAEAKGLVCIEEFSALQNLVKKLEKQIETLLKGTKKKPKGKRG